MNVRFNKTKLLLLILALPAVLMAAYVTTILFRVSLAEQELYGRSDLVPLSLSPPKFTDPPTLQSYGDKTYSFSKDGKTLQVYEQLINSFQHVYGSALASYELGRELADSLFRANEYFEAVCWRNSGTEGFYLDTKKDLGNNAIGREIGQEARKRGLSGSDANQFILDQVLRSIDNGVIFTHFQDPRVKALPTLRQYGCPLLSKLQELRGMGHSPTFE